MAILKDLIVTGSLTYKKTNVDDSEFYPYLFGTVVTYSGETGMTIDVPFGIHSVSISEAPGANNLVCIRLVDESGIPVGIPDLYRISIWGGYWSLGRNDSLENCGYYIGSASNESCMTKHAVGTIAGSGTYDYSKRYEEFIYLNGRWHTRGF